jgi:hypothetical protein
MQYLMATALTNPVQHVTHINKELIPWKRALQKNLIHSQLVKFSKFIILTGSLQCSQESANCSHSEPMDPVHIILSYFFKIHFHIASLLCLHLANGLFRSGFPAETL